VKLFNTSTALAGAALLAACGQQADRKASVAANGADMSSMMGNMGQMAGNMGNMAMPAGAAKSAHGAGTVKAIDKTAGTITLDHGPIAEANWPAMTMAFKASPALLDSVAVGDRVAFDLKLEGGSGEVTAINKR